METKINTTQIATMLKKIADHRATTISNTFDKVKTSFYIFQANYEALNKWLRILEKEDFITEKLNTYKDPTIANAYLDETARLLHNYLASAFSLVDHTRNMISELYENTQFRSEYQQKLDETLTNNSLRKFIQDLRAYLTHYYVPILTLNFQLKNDTLRCDVTLKWDNLKNWAGWTSLSKEFLQNNKKIVLKSLTNEYFQIVSDFYTWLAGRQQEIHKSEFEEILKLTTQYDEMMKTIFGE